MQTAIYILLGILMFGICVVVHELGHYIAGRKLGLKVLEFAIGMGPKVFSWHKNGIDYSLRLLPIGGFCAFAGEDDGDESENSINNKPAWRRLVMTAAGPFMNFVLGFVIAAVILAGIGEYQTVNKVALVNEGSPAAAAGLMVGDVVGGVNGVAGSTDEILDMLGASGEEAVTLNIVRNGEPMEVSVGKVLSEDGSKYLMGISFGMERVRMNVFQAIGGAFSFCFDLLKEMVQMLGGMFFKGEGLGEVSGPVGVISVVTDIARVSFADSLLLGIDNMLRLTLIISLNLGLMNLLPLPALDGGRIVLLAIEAITKKHLPRRVEGAMNFVALIILMGLILVITGKDILTLIGVI